MKITKNNKLTLKPEAFLDAHGQAWIQVYKIYLDSKDTGVTKVVNGKGRKQIETIFHAKGQSFDNIKDALSSMGYECDF